MRDVPYVLGEGEGECMGGTHYHRGNCLVIQGLFFRVCYGVVLQWMVGLGLDMERSAEGVASTAPFEQGPQNSVGDTCLDKCLASWTCIRFSEAHVQRECFFCGHDRREMARSQSIYWIVTYTPKIALRLQNSVAETESIAVLHQRPSCILLALQLIKLCISR